MRRGNRWLVGGIAGAALVAGGAGIAAAAGGDDNEPAITGAELQKASAAALAHTGGGRVTDTEVGDEDGYYEVEVTLDNGRQIDVHLDRDFQVLDSSTDSENDGEDDAEGGR